MADCDPRNEVEAEARVEGGPAPGSEPEPVADLPRHRHFPGLLNLGNTCYANAVIQALRVTPSLAALMVQRRMLQREAGGTPDGPVAAAWHGLLAAMWRAAQHAGPAGPAPLHPAHFLNTLLAHARGILAPPGVQGDAAEFAEGLLDVLHTAEVEGSTDAGAAGVGLTALPAGATAQEQARHAWRAFARGAPAVSVTRGLYGLTRHETECVACGARSAPRFEPFASLRLPLPDAPPDGAPLQPAACLAAALGPEEVGDFACERCKGRGSARRLTRLAVLPPCLLLVMKRFDNDGHKVGTPVAWDLDDVDVSAHARGAVGHDVDGRPLEGRGAARYLAYAAVHHYGSLAGGHYVTCVRGSSSSDWVVIDDAVACGGAPAAIAGGPCTYLLFLCRPDVWAELAAAQEEVAPRPATPVPPPPHPAPPHPLFAPSA